MENETIKDTEEKAKNMIDGQVYNALRNSRLLMFGFMACMMVLSFIGGYLAVRLATGEKIVSTYMEERRVELSEMRGQLKIALDELAVVKEKLVALELIKQTILTDISRKEARTLTEGISDRREREDRYDWLLKKNTERLFEGKQPCRDLGCTK